MEWCPLDVCSVDWNSRLGMNGILMLLCTCIVCQEAFNDAAQFRDEARQMFRLGLMTLAQAALVEDLHAAICARALQVRCR